MKLAILTGAAALLTLASAAQAQVAQPPAAPATFDQAAYITCREAHTMVPEQRKQLAIMLAELGTIATAQRDFRAGYDALARSLSVNEGISEPSGFSLVFGRRTEVCRTFALEIDS